MTDTTRDLIERMAKELDLVHQELMDDRRKRHPLANEARAYLAQPEPEGLTEEEIEKLADDYMFMDGANGTMHLQHIDFARAVIAADRARWGRAAVEPPAKPAHNTAQYSSQRP